MQTKQKKKRGWLWIILAVVVLAVLGLTFLNSMAQKAAQTVYASYTVETGTVERTITGSAMSDKAIEPAQPE